MSPTATITIQAGQKAYMVAHKAMGAGASAAIGLRTFPCFKLNSAVATTAASVVGSGVYDHQVPANTRVDFVTTWVFTTANLTAGTAYKVGLCAGFTSTGNWTNWSNNEFGGISVTIANSN